MSLFEFDAEFASAASDLLDAFGEQATYHAPQCAPVTLTVSTTIRQTEREETDGGTIRAARMEVLFAADPDGAHGGVAAPQLDAYFEISGAQWSIERLHQGSASLWRATCIKRSLRERRAGQGYRAGLGH